MVPCGSVLTGAGPPGSPALDLPHRVLATRPVKDCNGNNKNSIRCFLKKSSRHQLCTSFSERLHRKYADKVKTEAQCYYMYYREHRLQSEGPPNETLDSPYREVGEGQSERAVGAWIRGRSWGNIMNPNFGVSENRDTVKFRQLYLVHATTPKSVRDHAGCYALRASHAVRGFILP